MKNSKGITLIALIITILVMLILAAVTISMIVGENGIMQKTESAKLAQEKATAIDEVGIAWSSMNLKKVEYEQEDIFFCDEYILENQKIMNNSIKSGKVIDIAYQKNDVTTVTYVSKNNNEFLIQIGKDGKTSAIDGWIQNKEQVKKDGIILNVGDKVTGYIAGGVTEWYVLGAEHGKLLITAKTVAATEKFSQFENNINGIKNIKVAENIIDEYIQEKLNKTASDNYTDNNYAENVRSFKVQDVNRALGVDPNEESSSYGNIYENKSGKVVDTHYNYVFDTDIYSESLVDVLVLENNQYWLASKRCKIENNMVKMGLWGIRREYTEG